MLYFIKTIYKIIILIFLFSCISVITANAAITGEIVSSYLNVRPSPGKDSPPVISLIKGTKIEILKQQEDWYKIKYQTIIGYVSNKYVEIINNSLTGEITADRLNFRAFPDISSEPISLLPKGVNVNVLEIRDHWVKIKYNDRIGFVSKKYISVKSEKSQSFDYAYNNSDQSEISDSYLSKNIKNYKNLNYKNIEEKKQDIKHLMRRQKQRLKTCNQREKDIIAELDSVDRELNYNKKKLLKIKSEIYQIDNKIFNAQKKASSLVNTITEAEKYVSKRLVALYKLSRMGTSQLICSTQSINDLFVNYKNLEYILGYDDKIQKKLIQDKAQMEKLFEQLRLERNKKQILLANYKDTTDLMKAQKNDRSVILAEIQNKKSLTLEALKSLKNAQKELDEIVSSLKRKENNKNRYYSDSFKRFKGKLLFPVNGEIISSFGAYKNQEFGVMNFRSGVDIRADKGEPIKAVCSGKVLFSDWFKGYGNMIIIDHGDNYYTVYAHADELFKQKGEAVELGEVVGTLGDTGSIDGPSLYFEVRHHGKPMNPMKWLKKG